MERNRHSCYTKPFLTVDLNDLTVTRLPNLLQARLLFYMLDCNKARSGASICSHNSFAPPFHKTIMASASCFQMPPLLPIYDVEDDDNDCETEYDVLAEVRAALDLCGGLTESRSHMINCMAAKETSDAIWKHLSRANVFLNEGSPAPAGMTQPHWNLLRVFIVQRLDFLDSLLKVYNRRFQL